MLLDTIVNCNIRGVKSSKKILTLAKFKQKIISDKGSHRKSVPLKKKKTLKRKLFFVLQFFFLFFTLPYKGKSYFFSSPAIRNLEEEKKQF